MPRLTAGPGKLTCPQAAELLGVTPYTLRRQVRRGRIPGAFLIGHTWRFDEAKLKAFLEAGGHAAAMSDAPAPRAA